MKDKVEIVYFYSGLCENRKDLSKLSKKLRQERKSLRIRLINVEDPKNEELTESYTVSMIPVMIFFTPRGEIATRRCVPLSDEKIVYEITDRINKGEIPNPLVEEARTKILEQFKNATKRSDLAKLVVEQIENDLMEADKESEIHALVNSHISAINHTISDLQEFRSALQRFSKKQQDFVI